MASTIVTKNSSTASAVPLTGDLTQGELAVNVTDKRLFTKNSGGTVVELGTNPASLALPNGTANGVAYLNGSKVVTTGTALTFDGTSLGVAASGATQTLIRPYTGGGYGAIYSGAVTPSGTNFVLAYNATETDINAGTFISHLIGGSEQMRLTSTGLGIGTTSPSSLGNGGLTLGSTSSGKSLIIYSSSAGNNGLIQFLDTAGNNAFQLSATTTQNAIYGYGARSLVIYTNDTLRATFDTSGNLGIGTSSPLGTLGIAGSATTTIVIPRSSNGTTATPVETQLIGSAFTNGTYPAGIYALNSFTNNSGNWLAFKTTDTGNTTATRMTLDSSGNLGVGTTSPTARVHAYSGTAMKQLTVDGAGAIKTGVNFASSGTTYGQIYFDNNAPYDMSVVQQYTTGSLIFGTNSTERARIDSSGNLLLGNTSYGGVSGSGANAYFGAGGTSAVNTGFLGLNGSSASGYGAGIGGYSNGTNSWFVGSYGFVVSGTNTFLAMRNSGGGGVYLNGSTATSWTAVSDETRKVIIENITDAANKVSTLRTVIGRLKTDDETVRRPYLIAQDVQAVLPEAVSETEDKEGPVLGLSYTEVIPLLVAAIKEQQALITQLTERISALEGK